VEYDFACFQLKQSMMHSAFSIANAATPRFTGRDAMVMTKTTKTA